MAKLALYGTRSPVVLAQASTYHMVLAACGVNPTTAAEATFQRTIRAPGVASNLYCRITANSIAAASTLTTRKGGAAGGQSLTIGSTATGEFEDTTGSDAWAAGDLVNARLVTGTSGANTISLSVVGVAFAATTSTATAHGQAFAPTFSTASVTAFTKYAGQADAWSTTESALHQLKLRCAGTIRNLNVVVISNLRASSATTVGNRLNGANSAMSVSIPALTTGQFEDTTHSDTVALGDLVNRYLTTGAGTESCQVSIFSDLITTDGSTQPVNSGGTNLASATNYVGAIGKNLNATEAFLQSKAAVVGTASQYEVYTSANTIVGSSIVTFRKNAGAGNGVITCTGLTTGWFEDTTHSDALVATDEIGWQIVGGAAGTSMLVDYLSYRMVLIENGTAAPSGVSVASGINAATASGAANADVAGVTVGSGINAPAGSGAGNAAATGVGVGSGVGTPGGAGAGDATVTGVTADTDVGQPTATGGAVAAPSGVGVTSSVHAPTASAPDGTATPAGVSVTTGVGQATAHGNAPPPTPGYTGGGTPPGPKYQRRLHRPPNPFAHITVTPERAREYDVIRDGTARPYGVGVRVGVGRANAATESFARPAGVAVHAGVGVPQCAGDACASPDGVEVGVSVAYLEPWGVVNPSDAELMDWTLGLIDA